MDFLIIQILINVDLASKTNNASIEAKCGLIQAIIVLHQDVATVFEKRQEIK
jgi:hypothetical protein